MKKEPKAEDLHKPREYNGKEWYYCFTKTGGKCNGVYCHHKPSKCRGTAGKTQQTTGKRKHEEQTLTQKKKNLKQVQIKSAMAAVLLNGNESE